MEHGTAHRMPELEIATDPTPTAIDWAAYFARYPNEQVRLAVLDRDEHDEPPLRQPAGVLATARRWARYFGANAEKMASLAAQKPPSPPSEPVEFIDADGRRGWKL